MLVSILPLEVMADEPPDAPQAEFALTAADIPEAAGHVVRLRDEEPDNQTVVFLNADGTRTSYTYGAAVKYSDENGVVRDKNNAIKDFNNEYGNTAGDVELKFPKKLNKIKIKYQNHNVQLSPVTDVPAGHINGAAAAQ